jgi:hypothetical protein
MAKKKQSSKKDSSLIKDTKLYQELTSHFSDSDKYVQTVRDSWDEKEGLLVGALKDNLSQTTKSQVSDPRLSTIVLERAARVMGQLPTGKTLAVSKDDKGKNTLMNLILDKYAIPNANSQFDYLTKSRLLDVYSLVYGVMFAMVDWRVDEKQGYIGPDFWIIPIRDAFPQAGAISIDECERFQVRNMVTKKWLEERDEKVWTGLSKIKDELKNMKGKSRADMDSKYQSHQESTNFPDNQAGEIELRTEYRTYGGFEDKGEWITYSPDFNNVILRRIDNPHKDGQLPIVAKYAFPLIDSIFGLGEFERGKTIQYAINSLINLYLDGVKMSIFPPMLINPDGVVPSSIKFQPASKWLQTKPGSIDQLRINPQGLATFQSTYSFLIAALMNQAGTTDTTVSQGTDPGLGKTPEALKQLAQRESSRDNWDRFMMEKTQEAILEKFANLIASKQEKPIKLRLFTDEIEEIAQQYPDVMELVGDYENSERVELTANVNLFKDGDAPIHFDYQIVSGSTARIDEEAQLQNLSNLLQMFVKNPGLIQAIREGDKDINFAELITRFISSSGIQDWDKIIVDYVPPNPQGGVSPNQPGQQMPPTQAMGQPQMSPEQVMGQLQDPQLQQFAQQILGNMGQIPPQEENVY